jgi:predicted secreted protein
MKKLTLITLFFISAISFAQNKFIEVEVTDTIALKPLNFQCNVYIDIYNYETVVVEEGGDEEYDPLAAKEKAKNKLQGIKAMLEAKKYKVTKLDESKINMLERRRQDSEGLTIMVNGEAEMQKLKDLLDDKQDVETVVTVLKYANEQQAEEQLIKKLLDKAKARAVVIGANSGLKPGNILEVKEGERDSSLNDFYTQLAKLGKFGTQNDGYTGSLSKTFVVKFAAE